MVGLYAAGMLAIGAYYARRTRNADDYYLGGRSMRPSMVGLSLFATLISTISYLATPGEMMQHGPIAPLMYLAALPVIYLVVGFILIPYITKLPITSAYEILEKRLGRGIRLLGSTIFVVIRLVWMGLVVYTASRAVTTVIGFKPESLPWVVLTLGAITVVYSSMGGLRAVVLTDVIQSFILFLGALLCVGIITVKMGGFGWFPTEWSENWDTQPWFSFDPTVRVTVFGSIVATTVWWVCTAGSDQMAIQRYLATRDAKAARRAFLYNNLADVVVTVVLVCLGFALLGFFKANPQHLPHGLSLESDTEYLFPHFIVTFMRYGLAGLVLSGLLAAAMSSLSSGVNSASTVINVDIVGFVLNRELSERTKVRMGRWMTVLIGIVVIGFGLVVGKVPGNLYEVTSKTNGLFVAPLFGLFFLAMFVRFATPFGAAFGALYGILAAFLIAFWDLTGNAPLSFQWIGAGSLVATVGVGILLSLIPTRGKGPLFKAVLATVCAIPFAGIICWFTASCAA